jgi:uncharacterized coiled-coil protein SlyX
MTNATIEERIKALETKWALAERIGALETKLGFIEQLLNTLIDAVNAMKEWIDEVEKKTKSVVANRQGGP